MWNNKTAVVAGGSKGLGFQIASQFLEEGCNVAILARTKETVNRAVAQLDAINGNSVVGFVLDLSDDEQRRTVIEQIAIQFDRIDVWVNAVGQSVRTSFENASLASYRELMEQNFFVSVGCSIDVLPQLQKSSGYLINIGSLASRTAWPFVGPYVTSKHALAGFAKQLRLEGPENVHSLFVCPGPIANSDQDRYRDQSDSLDANARKPGAGAPVKAIDPVWLANKIIAACESKKTELVIPVKSRILFTLLQIWPGFADRLVKKFSKPK